ncbi:MAG TPA: TetR/AcrR family transcriptional regulator [Ilumatobacteraceae bacterium]|jgi:AcrR family transcriptional regulator|nr:TetR/AcrR family transcriptional regulator [Ilumatobacteraceae bacterium]
MADAVHKPAGRDAVMDALVDATGQLILERGVTMSVRDIARRAGVNHGLVHTYFGSKEALLSAAFGHLVDRAAAELDDDGFPPADLAFRRGGEVARALARTMLDVADDPYPSHPILPSWRAALATSRPDATDAELDEAVIVATTLGLGWALFAEHLCGILDVDEDERGAIEQRVLALISDIGGIPNNDTSASSDDRPSD